MKKSIAIAAMLVVGAGAAGVSAATLPANFSGSDTLFNVTRQAIANTPAITSPSTIYIGGGSGNGQSAMAAGGNADTTATQQIAPMSRMVNSGNSVCKFNGDSTAKGVNLTKASGIIVGLDAVDVLSGQQSGTQQTAACNLLPNGVAAAGTTSVFSTTTGQTWKWALALVYGGKDYSNSSAPVDCNSAARLALVNNWSKLIQGEGCNASTAKIPANSTGPGSNTSASQICSDSNHVIGGHAVLWHAYRRDEASGTSDVFSSILGITPATSNSAVGGFGTSPYCNAMNWDANALNNNCAYGPHDQFTGPGGIPDPLSVVLTATGAAAAPGDHRRPPAGVWGETPNPGFTGAGYDVLPTEMQDNDPVRRPCLGGGTNNHNRSGEEVCNIDGKLGLVLPMVDGDFLLSKAAPGNVQYPVNNCNDTGTAGSPPNIISCPVGARVSFRSGECPNGDANPNGTCIVPVDLLSSPVTSQCVSTQATTAVLVYRTGNYCSIGDGSPNDIACTTVGAACGPGNQGVCRQLGSPDGRVYNVGMRDGNVTGPGGPGFAQVPLPALGATATTDFFGAYYRIHQVETVNSVTPNAMPGCQMVDMTDQIGCLTATDPCSIGYAGDGAKSWSQHTNGFQSWAHPAVACTNDAGCAGATGFPHCVSGFCSVNLDQAADTQSFPTLPQTNAWETGALNVGATGQAIAAGQTGVQKLGQANEYQLARKLYLNSLVGFNSMVTTGSDTTGGVSNTPGELDLANNEASTAFMNPILTPLSFFPLGSQPPHGNLCEDFNEQTICGNPGVNNINGCTGNVAPIPGANAGDSTVCGDGHLDPFEECDPGVPTATPPIPIVNAPAGHCSSTCRCTLDYNVTTGVCN